ncbi:MAG: hypothetical protein A3F78_04715 [Burkholderiales bacterium RIFCSPLOWO2_12_FULL_61_40]|nr:MAG: hypothetical protein A3F78_04715 [Burkholderiales bacterium RIFCSPLOWO2_12_FULL_61_40]
MPISEPEVLAQVLTLVAALAGLGWAVFGLKLNISRVASLHFSAANLLLVSGAVVATFRASDISFFKFYQAFSVSDLLILGGTMLFRSGMRDLYGLRCTSVRDHCLVALSVVLVMVTAHAIGMQNAAGVGVYLTAAWFALRGYFECSTVLRKSFSRTTAWVLLWPVMAAGVLFILRALDDTLAMMHTPGDLSDTMKVKHFTRYMWAQLLVLMLLNASLIGLTLTALINKLNEQATRLQKILDTAPVGVAVSTGGIIRFANPRVGELLDMKVGDSASNALVWPQTREKIVMELKTHGTVNNMEVQMYCPRHSVRDLLVTYLPTDYEGQPGILGWMVDITERKRAEQAIRQASDEQSAIFESATLGIAFIKDGTIVRANHRLEELFGWDHGALLGQSPRIWYPPGIGPDNGPYADIQRGETHYSTQELSRQDGSSFWCRLSGSAIDHEDLSRGTVWMFDDVTAERQAAELMREARDLAEDATRMKSDFLANMSHEIRTPMNAIIGMSHLALQTDLQPKQRNYIEKVDSAARNLLGIINDILDFSKIEADKMRFEVAEFHLEDVMENLADLSVIKAQDKGLELLFDVAPEVPTALVGDPLRLGQVLINLVGNAIKFTDRGEITVGIRTVDFDAERHPGQIRLRFDISDTGVGLSEEQRTKLFSAFTQADASTTRKYGGTGLGLTICKRLVELMDGDISAQSQVGVGSTFTFTAQFGLQAEQRVRTTLDADVTGLRILVVDDNARAREIMMAILASQKFAATAVPSGLEAITALEEAQDAGQPYGLVLMDWMMPGLDGLATVQRIRADPRLGGVPAFVMVTAHSRDELMEQAGATRIDGLLLKPVGPSALLDSILCALGKEVVTRGRKQQRQEASHEAEQRVRGAYVLLVEDNEVNQELALEILQGAGIRVDVANNGAEAVGQVNRNHYDGVLMDCQMPVMDGFEATRQIRADGRFHDLPILAMTANAMSGDRELCLEAGMNDHIGKPIDVNQLFTSLARWITPSNPQATALDAPEGARPGREGELPAIAGLDLNLAMRRMGGNAKLMRKLIARFAETQADAMARIQQAMDRRDLDTATREAHTTKGLAGNIGATQLLARAGAVESLLKAAQWDALPQALDAMAQELTGLLAQIAQALAPAVLTPGAAPLAAPPVAVDREVLAKELQQLAALLADDDARAAKLVEGITDKLRNVGQGAVGSQIQKLIGKYEFEDALDKLKETAQALDLAL